MFCCCMFTVDFTKRNENQITFCVSDGRLSAAVTNKLHVVMHDTLMFNLSSFLLSLLESHFLFHK